MSLSLFSTSVIITFPKLLSHLYPSVLSMYIEWKKLYILIPSLPSSSNYSIGSSASTSCLTPIIYENVTVSSSYCCWVITNNHLVWFLWDLKLLKMCDSRRKGFTSTSSLTFSKCLYCVEHKLLIKVLFYTYSFRYYWCLFCYGEFPVHIYSITLHWILSRCCYKIRLGKIAFNAFSLVSFYLL